MRYNYTCMSNILKYAKQKQELDYDVWIELCQLLTQSELQLF